MLFCVVPMSCALCFPVFSKFVLCCAIEVLTFMLFFTCCSMLCRLCSLTCVVLCCQGPSFYFVIPVLFFVVPWSCALCFPVFSKLMLCRAIRVLMFTLLLLCCSVLCGGVVRCFVLCFPVSVFLFYVVLCCQCKSSFYFVYAVSIFLCCVAVLCCRCKSSFHFVYAVSVLLCCAVLCCQCESSFHFVYSVSVVTFHVVLSM